LLVLVEEMFRHRVLGSTMDDAAGECFDKTGKLMGLAYPAGPEMDRLAAAGNPKAYASFPGRCSRAERRFQLRGPEDFGPLFFGEEPRAAG
jgi:N6-L-threonylcarbamoyladenine synthase